jgi:hypothetical protein
MSIPATFPAQKPSFLFRVILLFYCLALGVAPSAVLAFWPTGDEQVFFKSPVILALAAVIGILCSAIIFVVGQSCRQPVPGDLAIYLQGHLPFLLF